MFKECGTRIWIGNCHKAVAPYKHLGPTNDIILACAAGHWRHMDDEEWRDWMRAAIEGVEP